MVLWAPAWVCWCVSAAGTDLLAGWLLGRSSLLVGCRQEDSLQRFGVLLAAAEEAAATEEQQQLHITAIPIIVWVCVGVVAVVVDLCALA